MIARADLGGGHPQAIKTSWARLGLAVDAHHIHYASGTSIGRADLDGGNDNRTSIIGAGSACGVAIDPGHV